MTGADSDCDYWKARGQHPVPCTDGGSCWVRNERFSFVRSITRLGPPDDRERRLLFWNRLTPLVGYAIEASETELNANYYVCRDREYDVERLPRKSRRDVRRGLRAVEVRRISFDEVARSGYCSFAETRSRNQAGAPDAASFAADCRLRAGFACQAAWGAFADGALVAWMTTHRVGAHVDLGSVSLDWEKRALCASYALVYTVTRHALVEEQADCVAYGLSSLQEESRIASLHQFKLWLGFRAVPVQRCFEPHPLLSPLSSPLALRVASYFLAHAPQHRAIRKLRGVVSLMRRSPAR
jgi:hypothetical protein